jgi:hypothetical protein
MIAWLAIVLATSGAGDSVLTLGRVERDLTGDGAPETVSLTGVRVTADRVDVTLKIQSSERTLYSLTWPVTRTVGYDRGRRRLSDSVWQAWLDDLGPFFFQPSKFMTPDGFVAMLGRNARLHIDQIPHVINRDRRRQQPDAPGDHSHAVTLWAEMQRAGVTVFEFSTGGDGVTAIAWSPSEQRFYRLLECC